MRAVLVGTLTVLYSAAGATAQQGDADARARRAMEQFQLFNECRPVDLVVEGVDQDARDIGIDRDRLTVVAESRLRSARLFDGDQLSSYLYVNVNVTRSAFSIGVSLRKWLYDTASGDWGFANTWNSGSAGTHGRSGDYIVQAVSEHVDMFLVEYLRVNDRACGP